MYWCSLKQSFGPHKLSRGPAGPLRFRVVIPHSVPEVLFSGGGGGGGGGGGCKKIGIFLSFNFAQNLI